MKRILFTLVLFSAVTAFGFKNPGTAPVESVKIVKLTVIYRFTGIVEGYDHMNKTEVYIDGQLAGTSSIKKESEENSVVCETTKGNHTIRIVNYSEYEGVWKEHTIKNDFSLDCIYETNEKLKKKNNSIKLVFDIDAEETRREK